MAAKHPESPAAADLRSRGVAFALHEVKLKADRNSPYDVARALGIDTDRLFVGVRLRAGSRDVIALTPCMAKLNAIALANAVGTAEAIPETAETQTYLGPFGAQAKNAAVCDISAVDFPTVFVPADDGHFVEVAADDLVRARRWRLAPIADFD